MKLGDNGEAFFVQEADNDQVSGAGGKGWLLVLRFEKGVSGTWSGRAGRGGEVLAPGGVDGAADRSACAGAGAGRAARAASTPPPRLPPRARWSPGTAEANRAGPNEPLSRAHRVSRRRVSEG